MRSIVRTATMVFLLALATVLGCDSGSEDQGLGNCATQVEMETVDVLLLIS